METTRLELRVPPGLKDLAEKAATCLGLTTTAFVKQVVAERAQQVMQDYATIKLGDRDREVFLAILESPPEPNEYVRQAFAEYRKSGGK